MGTYFILYCIIVNSFVCKNMYLILFLLVISLTLYIYIYICIYCMQYYEYIMDLYFFLNFRYDAITINGF